MLIFKVQLNFKVYHTVEKMYTDGGWFSQFVHTAFGVFEQSVNTRKKAVFPHEIRLYICLLA